jgi:hypothetical protein
MTITRFEDIEAWQMARRLSQKVYALVYEGGLQKDFSLKDQILRATGSIMDNIAEGFDAGGNNEFVRFLNYSKRSCSEVQSQLYRILDQQYCSQSRFDELYEAARLIRAKICAFISYLESSTRRSPATQRSATTGNQEPGTRNS